MLEELFIKQLDVAIDPLDNNSKQTIKNSRLKPDSSLEKKESEKRATN